MRGMGEMKRNVWLAAIFLCLVIGAFAESYIVTKDGKGFWTTSVRKEAENILYLDQVSGEEKSLTVASIDGIIPTVKKGVQYTQEQIQTKLDNVRNLQARHAGLLRDLNPLLQMWESMQKGDPGLEKKIDDIAETFRSSDKLVKAYKSAVMDLGVIKFKDVQGKYGARIDGLVEGMKKDFIAAGLARLESSAGAVKIGVDDFIEMKNLAGALSDAGQKEKAGVLLEKARLLALGMNARDALGTFASVRTLDAYLVSHNILVRTRNEVASEDSYKKKLDGMIEALIKDAGKAQPAFNFELRGFPMTKDDSSILSGMQRFSSRVTFTSWDLDEQCYVFPLQRPELIRMNKHFSVPLRLVFNRAQPKDRVFGLTVLIQGQEKAHTHTVRLDNVQIKNGHAEVIFTDELDQAEKGFVPAPDRDGRYGIYVNLGYRTSADGDAEQYRPISCACRFPM